MKIRDRHRQAIKLLVEGATAHEVAQTLKLTINTVVEWMATAEFEKEWVRQRTLFIENPMKFSDLAPRVPAVIGAILNRGTENTKLRASEVWMRGVELEEKRRDEVKGPSRVAPEFLDPGVREEQLCQGFLLAFGKWEYLPGSPYHNDTGMAYTGGMKYWDEVSVETLIERLCHAFSRRWQCSAIGMEPEPVAFAGAKFALETSAEEAVERLLSAIVWIETALAQCERYSKIVDRLAQENQQGGPSVSQPQDTEACDAVPLKKSESPSGGNGDSLKERADFTFAFSARRLVADPPEDKPAKPTDPGPSS